MHKSLQTLPSQHIQSPYGPEAASSCSWHTPPSTHLALVYFSFSDLICFNSGLHRFNLWMKNAVWHFIWLPRMRSGWPSFLMKLCELPSSSAIPTQSEHLRQIGVCNKLCCAALLRTELMCRDFTFQHHSGRDLSIKCSTVPTMLPKQVFTSPPCSVNDLFTLAAFVI